MIMIVDSNEQATSPTTVQTMSRYFPGLLVSKLDYGDVNIVLDDGKILAIERKEARDLLASIADGRLFNQVERMSKADYRAIIVLGSISYTTNDMVKVNGDETEWYGPSVRGAIWAVQYSACPVLFTWSDEWMCIFIQGLIDFVSKPPVHWQGKKIERIVTFPPIDDKVNLLAQLKVGSPPNMGIKRAQSLVSFASKQGSENEREATLAECLCWGSALSLINRDSRPDGWGNKTVDNFREALGLKPGQYLEIREEG